MAYLWRAATCLVHTAPFKRSVFTSPLCALRKIDVTEVDGTVTVKSVPVESPRAVNLIQAPSKGSACVLCALNLYVKHTDVLILSQFVRSDGCLLPRRVTGLCVNQQSRVKYLVAMAQKAGLMPNLAPSWSKRDPKQRYGYKKFNKYFDESTIKPLYYKHHIPTMVEADRRAV